MKVGDELIGVIRAADKVTGDFTEEDVRLLSIFATEAAAIIQNFILYQESSRRKERLDLLFNHASDAIALIDTDWRVLNFNPVWERLVGWDSQGDTGRRCMELCIHPTVEGEPQCDAGCPIWLAVQGQPAALHVETRIRACHGQWIDVDAGLVHVPTGPEERAYGMVILRDISRLKEVERLKADFVSLVSHELRTPLALIKGYTSTLLNLAPLLPEEKRLGFLQGIESAADRQRRLIDNLLSVSRMESGLFQVRTERLDLREPVRHAVEVMRAQERRHQIVLEEPAEPLEVDADRDQMAQVVENLVGNAVKYTPAGTRILVRLAGEEGGAQARLEVVDEGPGLPPDHLDRIFEKFVRVPGTSRTSGTGLGLYICRTIVEAHGGRIWAANNPDKGSTFTMVLPLGAGPGTDSAPGPRLAEAAQVTPGGAAAVRTAGAGDDTPEGCSVTAA